MTDMTLTKFMKKVPARIVGGDQYFFDCYGANARYLDFESNVSMIFNEVSGLIYELTMIDEGVIWRHPDYCLGFEKELVAKRGIKEEELSTRRSNVADINEIIEKVVHHYKLNKTATKSSGPDLSNLPPYLQGVMTNE